MPEMAHAGEDHGHAERSAAAITSWSLDRAAGLDDGGGSGLRLRLQGRRGTGKRVRCGDAALERQHGLHRAEACGVHAAHLARADTKGLAVAGIDDGVGFDVLAHPPGKEQAAQLLGGGRTPCDHLQPGSSAPASIRPVSASCINNPPDTCLTTGRGGAEWTSTRRRFFLAAKRSRASAVKAGSGDGLDKELGDLLGGGGVHFAIDADDSAEG